MFNKRYNLVLMLLRYSHCLKVGSFKRWHSPNNMRRLPHVISCYPSAPAVTLFRDAEQLWHICYGLGPNICHHFATTFVDLTLFETVSSTVRETIPGCLGVKVQTMNTISGLHLTLGLCCRSFSICLSPHYLSSCNHWISN